MNNIPSTMINPVYANTGPNAGLIEYIEKVTLGAPEDGLAGFAPLCTVFNSSDGNKYKNNADGSSSLWSLVPGELITGAVHITSAELLNLSSVPKVLVPAQGPGTIIDVLSVTGSMNFASAPYATHTNLDVKEGGILWAQGGLISSGVNVTKIFTQNGGSTITPNTPLTISTSGGNATAGGGSLDMFVTYKVYKTNQ